MRACTGAISIIKYLLKKALAFSCSFVTLRARAVSVEIEIERGEKDIDVTLRDDFLPFQRGPVVFEVF